MDEFNEPIDKQDTLKTVINDENNTVLKSFRKRTEIEVKPEQDGFSSLTTQNSYLLFQCQIVCS